MIFLADLVLMFFTTISENDDEEEIDNRYIIAKRYLKGWFCIDLLSITPFDHLMGIVNG